MAIVEIKDSKSDYPSLALSLRLINLYLPIKYDCDNINCSISRLFRYFFLPPENNNIIHSPIRLRQEILQYLVSGRFEYMNDFFFPNKNIFFSFKEKEKIPVEILKNIKNIIVSIKGKIGSGRKTLTKQFSIETGKPLLFINIAKLISDKKVDFFYIINNISCHAKIMNAIPVIYDTEIAIEFNNFENKINELISALFSIHKTIFIIYEEEIVLNTFKNDWDILKINIKKPNFYTRLDLWENLLKRHKMEIDLKENMTYKFDLTPVQINNALFEYKTLYGNKNINEKNLDRCCYHTIHSSLKKYADFIPSSFTLEQLILPKNLKDTLLDACSHVLNAANVYDKWGFGKRITYGNGVHILFTGPPGTGKTMAAQVVSSILGLDLYKIDSSKLVSKYIGETEKNFEQVFEAASKSSVILFFDEMDALFGKRSEITEANDKYANATTSYLLQKIEEYNGITLMATNYLTNVDEAFLRRIHYVLHFPMPSVADRKKLWQSLLSNKDIVKKDIDFDFLADTFEITGGVIKNIILSSAFLAAAENKPISMKHIITALYYDRGKQGKTIIKSEFGKYSFYIENF